MNRGRFLLTALIAAVVTAILIVGFFLMWDILDVNGRITDLINTDLYSRGEEKASSVAVSVKLTGVTLKKDEEVFFTDYFGTVFGALGSLSDVKLTKYYVFQTEYELFDKTALDHEISFTKSSGVDLSFESCDIELKAIRRRDVSRNKTAEITLGLYTSYKCAGLSQPVVTKGETHEFVLDKSGNAPLIKQHTTDRPARTAADMELNKTLAEYRRVRSDLAYSYYPSYIEAMEERVKAELSALIWEKNDEPYPEAEFAYDRVSAALAAVDGFSEKGVFERYEENDANFISICVFDSGIPMDSQGERGGQWKWYDVAVNYERKKTGCTESWFDRAAFYDYAVSNRGFGLVAGKTGRASGEIGDVVQLMFDGKPVLEFMITGILYADGGEISDYLLSNDVYTGVPLRTLGFTDHRIIHIVGYNTANI